MASIFGGSLRLALKQSLAETGHLAKPTKPSKKDRSKKNKRSKLKKERRPLPSSDEYSDESEGDSSSSCSSLDSRSISSTEQELGDDINDNSTVDSHNFGSRAGSQRRPTLKKKRKRLSKCKGAKKVSSKAVTLSPPSPDILSWIRNMPESHQKLSIAIGMRVKVRFDMGRKKKDKPSMSRRCLWYGGSVSDVLKNGKRVRIVYDDGTKEVSPFPDNDIVIDDKENGTHQVSADAFIPQNSTDEENFSDDSSVLSDKSHNRDEPKEDISKNDDTVHVENSSGAKDVSVSNSHSMIVSSPPSNKVSTVTESSFSHPSSSSAGHNDSCESSYSCCTNEYEFSHKSQPNPSVLSSNFSTPRITLSTSQPFQQHSTKETEQPKSSLELEKSSRAKPSASSLTIKLIPPKKPLPDKICNGQDMQVVDYSGSSADEHSNSVPTSLRISVVRSGRVKRPPKNRKRQRQTDYKDKNVDKCHSESVSSKSYHLKESDSDSPHEKNHTEDKFNTKYNNFRHGHKQNSSIDHSNIDKEICSSDEDSIIDHHELRGIGKSYATPNSNFDQSISHSHFVDSDGNELSSPDDNSGSMSSDNNDSVNDACEKVDQVFPSKFRSDVSKSSALSSDSNTDSTIPDECISKHNKTSSTQGSSPAHSMHLHDTDNEQICTSSINEAPRFSRVGRRAALKANERIAAKEIVLVDEYAVPKKRHERFDLKLFPIPVIAEQSLKSKPISSFNRQFNDSSEVEKDPWVQCDKCLKWRHLPPSVQMDELPERWYCEFNVYDLLRNTCNALEQSLEEVVMEKVLIGKTINQLVVNTKSENKTIKLKPGKKITVALDQNSMKIEDRSSHIQPMNSLSSSDHDIPSNICATSKRHHSTEFSSDNETCKMHPKKRARAKYKGMTSIASREDGSTNPPNTLNLKTIEPSENICDIGRNKKSNDAQESFSEFSCKGTANDDTDTPTASKKSNTHQPKPPISTKIEADNQEWVQCDKCKKWRTLPPRVSADDLPEIWYCKLNTWDNRFASCDIDEVKIESNVREYSIVNGTVAQMHSTVNTNNLSYRNLIFGTGRKLYRPTSERARAADSLFAYYDNDDESSAHPKFMYAESSAFCAKPSRNYECFKHQGFLDNIDKSIIWNELYGLNTEPSLIQKDDFAESSILNVKFRRKSGILNECEAYYKDLIIGVLSTKTLGIHEILYELSSSHCDATLEEILRDLRILYADECIEIVENFQTEERDPVPNALSSVDFGADSTGLRLTKYKKPWRQNKSKSHSPISTNVNSPNNSSLNECVSTEFPNFHNS